MQFYHHMLKRSFQKLAPHLATELDEIESRLNRMNTNKTVNDSQRSEVKGETSAIDDINLSSKSLTTPSAQSTPHPKPRPKVNVSITESPQVFMGLQETYHIKMNLVIRFHV